MTELTKLKICDINISSKYFYGGIGMLHNKPNSNPDFIELLVCPLCNALCEEGLDEDFQVTCAACGHTLHGKKAGTMVLSKEYLLQNYHKLSTGAWVAYVSNDKSVAYP